MTKVLDNGNLFVEGKKVLALSEGSEEVFISGIITLKDVPRQHYSLFADRTSKYCIVDGVMWPMWRLKLGFETLQQIMAI